MTLYFKQPDKATGNCKTDMQRIGEFYRRDAEECQAEIKYPAKHSQRLCAQRALSFDLSVHVWYIAEPFLNEDADHEDAF